MSKTSIFNKLEFVQGNVEDVIKQIREKRSFIQHDKMTDTDLKLLKFLKTIQHQLEGVL